MSYKWLLYKFLKAWKVNTDIKSAFNHYKVIIYGWTYFSKVESVISDTMNQDVKEARVSNNISSSVSSDAGVEA